MTSVRDWCPDCKETGWACRCRHNIPDDPAAMGAIEAIKVERKRQIEAEGWTPEHDDRHSQGELAKAAACYAVGTLLVRHSSSNAERGWRSPVSIWPWTWDWWKPSDRRRNLVKAGALIVAEIERLDRQDTRNAS